MAIVRYSTFDMQLGTLKDSLIAGISFGFFFFFFLSSVKSPIAQVVERPLRERYVVGSDSGRDIPKALKWF